MGIKALSVRHFLFHFGAADVFNADFLPLRWLLCNLVMPQEDDDVGEALCSLLEDECINLLLKARIKHLSGKSGDSVKLVIWPHWPQMITTYLLRQDVLRVTHVAKHSDQAMESDKAA